MRDRKLGAREQFFYILYLMHTNIYLLHDSGGNGAYLLYGSGGSDSGALWQWYSNFLARGPHLSFRNPSRATRINHLNKNSLK